MLSDIKYDDMKAVDLLKLGIRLVGELEKLGIWKPTEDKRARCQVQAVWSKAHTSQREVLKPKHQKDKEVEEAVWKTTLDEVESGLLEDPLTKEEIEDKVGPLWVAARRFGLKQGSKIRPIDDFAQFEVKEMFGTTEKVQLLSVGHVVAWARAWISSVSDEGMFQIHDSNGEVWAAKSTMSGPLQNGRT